jgi:hypothetical protein
MSEILRLPLFRTALANAAIGQGIMVMVMQSTPLAIAASGHHVTAGSWVIQWCVGAGASFAAGGLLHLVGWTAVNVGILPLIVVAGVMNLALLRRQRSTALPAPA